MNDIQTIFIVGAAIFGASAFITGCVFIYFVWRGWSAIARLTGKGADRAAAELHHVHWLNSIAVYLVLFTSFILLTMLYSMNATGMGFMVKPNLHIAHWARWLFLAAVGLIYNGCLAYVMTDDDRNYNKHRGTAIRVQSFFIVFYYVAAQIMIFFATVSSTVNAHIVCMVGSIVAFILSVLLYFFPHNKFALSASPKDYILFTSDDGGSGTTASQRYNVIMTYRAFFLGFIIISYIVNVIIWFMARSNDISDLISFKGELIAYLVSDFVFIVIFAFILIVLTLYFRMKTVSIKPEGGNGRPIYRGQANLGARAPTK